MKSFQHSILGHLDIFSTMNEDNFEGEILKWNEILIHGDRDGLKSFGEMLIKLSELDQNKLGNDYLPIGAREHFHLRPNIELSKSSNEVIVGRLDSKGDGKFYDKYIAKDKAKKE